MYWEVCPNLRNSLFQPNRPGYFDLAVEKAAIKPAIYEHPEFAAFIADMKALFETWRMKNVASLKGLEAGCQPKSILQTLSEGLLRHYTDKPLIDRYDIYQHLMEYWEEGMQDDVYLIAADGWQAETYRIIETDKKGREKDKGWTCDLIPKPLIVARYFTKEQAAIDELNADLESATARLEEVEEEGGAEDGVFAEFEKVNKQSVSLRLKEARAAYITNTDAGAEIEVLDQWLELTDHAADLKKQLKEAEADLDAKAYAHYPKLSEAEIKSLVVDDKWFAALEAAVQGEMERISQSLTGRVKELSERYETPLPQMSKRVTELEEKVNRHLEKMGFSWK